MFRALMLALAISSLATTGVAAAGNSGSTFVFTEPVTATLDACPDLPGGLIVEFTGTAHGHVHQSVDANGTVHVNVVTNVNGTAVDSEGATYRFNYHQALAVRDAGASFELKVTDHFNLVGNGSANRLRTFFVLKFAVTEAGFESRVENIYGDPALCDPL